MSNCCICWFYMHIFTGILIFIGLTARRLYKSFGVKGLILSLLHVPTVGLGGNKCGLPVIMQPHLVQCFGVQYIKELTCLEYTGCPTTDLTPSVL
jgi:hypothetical protein